eukprot:4893191-Prymnesium_polylepis.2
MFSSSIRKALSAIGSRSSQTTTRSLLFSCHLSGIAAIFSIGMSSCNALRSMSTVVVMSSAVMTGCLVGSLLTSATYSSSSSDDARA